MVISIEIPTVATPMSSQSTEMISSSKMSRSLINAWPKPESGRVRAVKTKIITMPIEPDSAGASMRAKTIPMRNVTPPRRGSFDC